jgi:manganese-dependent inorganic pyrophosphatase
MRPIYVVGHKNPDTDSIASAIGYAWKLGPEVEGEVLAARTGPVNDQTAWVLERLRIEAPVKLTDAAPQFGWTAKRLDAVTPERPLREAWDVLHRTHTVCPVVDPEGKPLGLITPLSVFELLRSFIPDGADPGSASLADLMARPAIDAADRGVPSFVGRTSIRDGIQRVLRDEHDDFLVVDDEGRYLGISRKPDLMSPERLRLVLVDHNGAGQSVGSLDEADIIEVVDHHRLENLPTRLPIRFTVEPVGSTSTIVWNQISRTRRELPSSLAGLLLAGIYSDTLMLTSPTTTQGDRDAVDALCRLAFAPGSALEGDKPEDFGKALLRAGAGLDARPPEELVRGDLKVYEAGKFKFGASQVEVADEPDLSAHLDRLRKALAELCAEKEFDFAVLMITEVVVSASKIVVHHPPPVLEELPYLRLADGTLDAPGVVSRKKQLLPTILALLER